MQYVMLIYQGDASAPTGGAAGIGAEAGLCRLRGAQRGSGG